MLLNKARRDNGLAARNIARCIVGGRVSEQPLKKSDHIAQILSERIVRGELQPGEKLRQDLIAREFGVSQVTVREALLHLSSQGLTVGLQRKGMCVAQMDQNTVGELQIMRCALEPVALRRSIPNLTVSQISWISRAHDACNAAETAMEWEEANRCFHMAIIAGCQMPRLLREIGNLQMLYSWHFNRHHSGRWKRREDRDHAAILIAAKDRNADRAVSVMQRHLARLS